jgi:hypothetical protein
MIWIHKFCIKVHFDTIGDDFYVHGFYVSQNIKLCKSVAKNKLYPLLLNCEAFLPLWKDIHEYKRDFIIILVWTRVHNAPRRSPPPGPSHFPLQFTSTY